MKTKLSRLLILCALLMQACTTPRESTETAIAPPSEPTQLRVSLFPYLPDAAGDGFRAMLIRIELEFEKSNPGIDLVLRPMDASFDPYDLAGIKQRFSETDDNASDVIELDAVMLGEVVKANLIREIPTSEKSSDWLSPARKAAYYDRKLYGLPHWLCGHFIVSRMEEVKSVSSVSDLIKILNSGDENVPNLSGNLLGSWNLPCLYLDAWADTYGPRKLLTAVSPNLDERVVTTLGLVADQQVVDGKNPGLDGTYDDAPDLAAEDFAHGRTEALVGYSEKLHVVLKNRTDTAPLYLTSACLGEGDRALAFADVFVVRREASTSVTQAAARFARYMANPATFEWIHNSEDAPKARRTPRYLAPATRSGYKTKSLRHDPHMQQVYRVMRSAGTFPQTGLLEKRKAMRDALLSEIQKN